MGLKKLWKNNGLSLTVRFDFNIINKLNQFHSINNFWREKAMVKRLFQEKLLS